MRYDDWQLRYIKVVETAQLLPFAWGVHDCATFASYIIDRISDRDTAGALKARDLKWSTAEEADAVIAAAGGLEALITSILGDPTAPLRCSRGDVMLAVNKAGREIVAIHDGSYLIAAADGGIVGLPLRSAVKGWRV